MDSILKWSRWCASCCQILTSVLVRVTLGSIVVESKCCRTQESREGCSAGLTLGKWKNADNCISSRRGCTFSLNIGLSVTFSNLAENKLIVAFRLDEMQLSAYFLRQALRLATQLEIISLTLWIISLFFWIFTLFSAYFFGFSHYFQLIFSLFFWIFSVFSAYFFRFSAYFQLIFLNFQLIFMLFSAYFHAFSA